MAFGNTNIAVSIHSGSARSECSGTRTRHQHHQNRGKEGPEKPDRNPFLDFLTAPLQMMGKGGNQNDKEYDKYSHAVEAGNALKGF